MPEIWITIDLTDGYEFPGAGYKVLVGAGNYIQAPNSFQAVESEYDNSELSNSGIILGHGTVAGISGASGVVFSDVKNGYILNTIGGIISGTEEGIGIYGGNCRILAGSLMSGI